MVSRVLCLLVLASLGLSLPAQIVGVVLDSRKVERKYSKWILEKKGQKMVVGEVLDGLDVKLAQNMLSKTASPKTITLLVPDPARPELELYSVNRRGEARLKAKHRRITLKPGDWAKQNAFHLVYRYENVHGLRQEYLRKKDQVDSLEMQLADHDVGSKEWFEIHRKLLVETDGLVAWLENGMFPVAAEKLAREYGKQLRKAGEVGSKSRLETAKGDLAVYAMPEDLKEKLREMRRPAKYACRSAQHVRVLGHPGMDGGTVEGLVILAERIIEGFRTDFIDPFLGPDDYDPVPEGDFVEFFFGPDDQEVMERLFEEYYHQSFGFHREKSIKIPGHGARGARGIDYLRFWRMSGGTDPEGIVGNAMGKVMANVAYNRGGVSSPPDWMKEAFGYWVSFDFLGRNTVTSIDWNRGSYGRTAKKEGVKPVEVGMRAAFNALAMAEGPALDALMVTRLADMEAPHLAKAWSFADFILTAQHDKSHRFFKAVCAARTRNGQTDLVKLRPKIQEIFGFEVKGRDVYPLLDEMWREYAARSQLGVKRKRK